MTRVAAAGGLASLGLLGAGVAAKKPGAFVRINRANVKQVRHYQIKAKKAGELATPVGISAGAIGGIGGLNSAGIQRHDAKQLKKAERAKAARAAAKKPVTKADSDRIIRGRPWEDDPPSVKVAEKKKASKKSGPSGRREFNPEERRQRRNKATSWGLGVGAGGVGAFGAHETYQGGKFVMTARSKDQAKQRSARQAQTFGAARQSAEAAAKKARANKQRETGHLKRAASNAGRERAAASRTLKLSIDAKNYRESTKAARALKFSRGRTGLIGGAALGTAAIANERHRRNHGKPYASHFDKR